jgi:hypothetical protein
MHQVNRSCGPGGGVTAKLTGAHAHMLYESWLLAVRFLERGWCGESHHGIKWLRVAWFGRTTKRAGGDLMSSTRRWFRAWKRCDFSRNESHGKYDESLVPFIGTDGRGYLRWRGWEMAGCGRVRFNSRQLRIMGRGNKGVALKQGPLWVVKGRWQQGARAATRGMWRGGSNQRRQCWVGRKTMGRGWWANY